MVQSATPVDVVFSNAPFVAPSSGIGHIPCSTVVVKIFGNSVKITWNEENQERGAMCTHIKGVMVRRVC